MTRQKESLNLFVTAAFTYSRKIILTAVFLIGAFFVALLSYQTDSMLMQLEYIGKAIQSANLSPDDSFQIMQKVLDGALITAALLNAAYAIMCNARNEKTLMENSVNMIGFLAAASLLVILPFNAITILCILIAQSIWVAVMGQKRVYCRINTNDCGKAKAIYFTERK